MKNYECKSNYCYYFDKNYLSGIIDDSRFFDVYKYNKETKQYYSIDPKSFVFTFKDDEPMRFKMKKVCKNEPTFLIGNQFKDYLFVFGNADILVGKKGILSYCCQSKDSYYNYGNQLHALTGISGENGDENEFFIKRVVVIQFK